MLTREIMGALALAVLWVNTLLIAAAALKQSAAHLRRLRDLEPLAPGAEGRGLLRGIIAEGDGPNGALARHEIEQIGRAGAEEGGRRTIHFGDRTFDGALLGGAVTAGDERVLLPAGEAEVWPDRADVLSAAACGDRARFDAVFDEARKARGHVRRVRVDLRAGSPVWIGGHFTRGPGGLTVRPGAVLVSAIDPRAWLRRAAAIPALFALAEVAVAAAVTALALVPPVLDGWPSKLGGLLGLGFFLGVQPLGTAVRDAVRTPGRSFLRGQWIEPGEPRSAPGEPAKSAPPA